MIQLKIAFLDEEEAYLRRLQSCLVRKKEAFFDVWTFHGAEEFLEQERAGAVFHAVVMTAPFWEQLNGHALSAKKILLCGDGKDEAFLGCLSVEKYQSAETLLRRICELFWQECGQEDGLVPPSAAELTGIYSPAHHEGQMLFGLTMAQLLAETKKTLYVNLMGHSGFGRLTGASFEEDVGDLLYGMLDEGHDFAAGLNRVRRTYRSFDFLPPAVNPEHLSEISAELSKRLFMALKNRSGYDAVIVDFGMACSGFAEFLPLFGSFYCIEKEGILNRCRTEEFLEYIEKSKGYGAVRLKRLFLPGQAVMEGAARGRGEADLLRAALYGDMGDCVRGCLYGGAEIGE